MVEEADQATAERDRLLIRCKWLKVLAWRYWCWNLRPRLAPLLTQNHHQLWTFCSLWLTSLEYICSPQNSWLQFRRVVISLPWKHLCRRISRVKWTLGRSKKKKQPESPTNKSCELNKENLKINPPSGTPPLGIILGHMQDRRRGINWRISIMISAIGIQGVGSRHLLIKRNDRNISFFRLMAAHERAHHIDFVLWWQR